MILNESTLKYLLQESFEEFKNTLAYIRNENAFLGISLSDLGTDLAPILEKKIEELLEKFRTIVRESA